MSCFSAWLLWDGYNFFEGKGFLDRSPPNCLTLCFWLFPCSLLALSGFICKHKCAFLISQSVWDCTRSCRIFVSDAETDVPRDQAICWHDELKPGCISRGRELTKPGALPSSQPVPWEYLQEEHSCGSACLRSCSSTRHAVTPPHRQVFPNAAKMGADASRVRWRSLWAQFSGPHKLDLGPILPPGTFTLEWNPLRWRKETHPQNVLWRLLPKGV